MLATSGRDRSERDIAMKLHRQFCHPSSEKLIKLVKNSRVKNKKKIEKEIRSITDQCITCIKGQVQIRVQICPTRSMFSKFNYFDILASLHKYACYQINKNPYHGHLWITEAREK